MKKLIALMAMVAMVAMSSVAYAATVNVTASVTAVTTLADCLGADFGTALDTEDTIHQASCTGAIVYTDAAGYDLDYVATTATLVSGTDVIESGATCAATNVECFSYNYDSFDPNDVIEASSDSEHAVVTGVAVVQAHNVSTYDGTYGFTFNAVSRSDTPSGSYTNSGTATVSAYTA
ncbi:hypothetical protein KKD70_05380 [Patescibacteria group bacterium]|nr:hypothetical protein [Patescibacteria group bacterium]